MSCTLASQVLYHECHLWSPLDHMVVLFSFWEILILFSQEASPCLQSQQPCANILFLCILANTCYFLIFWKLFILIGVRLHIFMVFLYFIYFLTLQYCIGFAIYQYESATHIHVFPILNTPYLCIISYMKRVVSPGSMHNYVSSIFLCWLVMLNIFLFACWPFVCYLRRNIYSSPFYPFLSFCCSCGILYAFWISTSYWV